MNKDINVLKEITKNKYPEYVNDEALDFRVANANINPHQKGVKLDNNKVDLDLVLGDFARALVEVGKVGTEGAKKYTPHGWISVPNGIRRYRSGMLRHHFKESEGELIDPDFGLMHSAHRAWNALAVLELQLRDIKKNGVELN